MGEKGCECEFVGEDGFTEFVSVGWYRDFGCRITQNWGSREERGSS